MLVDEENKSIGIAEVRRQRILTHSYPNRFHKEINRSTKNEKVQGIWQKIRTDYGLHVESSSSGCPKAVFWSVDSEKEGEKDGVTKR